MIITRFSQLIQEYHRLGAADVFIGQIPSVYPRSALPADLSDRGIRMVPSVTAQLLNLSKVAHNFRNNLSIGGHFALYALNPAQAEFLPHARRTRRHAICPSGFDACG
jgi:hypothetical protein